jgi:hypothetical protein
VAAPLAVPLSAGEVRLRVTLVTVPGYRCGVPHVRGRVRGRVRVRVGVGVGVRVGVRA